MITQVARTDGLALRARRPRAFGPEISSGRIRKRDELTYTSIKDVSHLKDGGINFFGRPLI